MGVLKITILSERNNYLKEIEEERNEWITYVLTKNEVNVKKDISEKELSSFLKKNKVSILHNATSNEYKVFKDSNHIATWGSPSFTIKRDNDTNDLYYLIEIQCWLRLEDEVVAAGSKKRNKK